MKGNIVLGLLLGVALGWFVTMKALNPKAMKINTGNGTTMMASKVSPKEFELYQNMRKLWEDHITWTRLVIVGIANNVPGNDKAVERLLKNAGDMAKAIEPYYGQEAADQFKILMEDHLKIAAKLVTEAKAGSAKAAQTEKDWYKNADDITTFLSGANPNWPKAALKDMLYGHLRLTKTEAVSRLQKNYTAEITAYDEIHTQALMMSDTLSQGIIKQFPEKF